MRRTTSNAVWRNSEPRDRPQWPRPIHRRKMCGCCAVDLPWRIWLDGDGADTPWRVDLGRTRAGPSVALPRVRHNRSRDHDPGRSAIRGGRRAPRTSAWTGPGRRSADEPLSYPVGRRIPNGVRLRRLPTCGGRIVDRFQGRFIFLGRRHSARPFSRSKSRTPTSSARPRFLTSRMEAVFLRERRSTFGTPGRCG